MIQQPTILLTDDDLGFRETVRAMLEPRGFRTFEAGDEFAVFPPIAGG